MTSLAHPCIEWDGVINSYGYGVTRLVVGQNSVMAHRVAYCVENHLDLSDIKGLIVRHKCDNRPCVQPSHLELGTTQDNANDMVSRGRSLTGASHHNSVLTEEEVLEIRKRYIKRCKTNGQVALGKTFGVSTTTVWNIINRNIWRHI